MKKRQIALKESIDETDVLAEASYNGWIWENSFKQTDEVPREIVFMKLDERTSIHYIEDYIVKVNFILAKGEEADQVIEEAKRSLDTYSLEEIDQDYSSAENHRQQIQAIYIAAHCAPFKQDIDYKIFFDRALQNGVPDVRLAVIVAMGYMQWIEWKDVLKDLMVNDPDETVRDSAEGMLNSFTHFGI